MLKKILFILVFILSIANISAISNIEETPVRYLYFYVDEDSQESNKISYELDLNQNIQNNDIFTLKLYKNTVEEEVCKKLITFETNTLYKKLTCEIPKSYGVGKYTFTAQITRDSEIIYETVDIVSISEDYISEMYFLHLEDKTQIFINVKNITANDKKIRIEQEIPKEVIEILNENNKDSLIESELEYKIIKEDPLIAWSVDQAPAKLNYTINKKISVEDTKDFKVNVVENSYFNNLKYVIFILILVIVLISFKPLYSKKTKTKK